MRRTWLSLTSWHPTKSLTLLPFLTLFSPSCTGIEGTPATVTETGLVVESGADSGSFSEWIIPTDNLTGRLRATVGNNWQTGWLLPR